MDHGQLGRHQLVQLALGPEDYGADYERWDANINLPGNFNQFQYAIVYRHGTVNGATVYDFSDNNGGQNFVVLR